MTAQENLKQICQRMGWQEREAKERMGEGVINIPEMTHPLSKAWDQPNRSELTFQKDRVLMTEDTLSKLKNYSTSIPTGAYEGKMWKREVKDGWMLCWYGEHPNPNKVSINQIKIKVVWQS